MPTSGCSLASPISIASLRCKAWSDNLLGWEKIRIKAHLTLVLLHDDQGHPREASTHRGDKHLIMGPSDSGSHTRDRRGSSAHLSGGGLSVAWLLLSTAILQALGHTVVTVLRTDQYEGLESLYLNCTICIIGRLLLHQVHSLIKNGSSCIFPYCGPTRRS